MGLVGSCALLGVVLAAVAGAMAWFSGGIASPGTVQAAVVAWLVCFGAAALALVVTFAGQRTGRGVHAILASTIVRTGIPLVAVIVLQRSVPGLAAAGVFSMILGLYLCALLVETVLSLRFVSAAGGLPKKALVKNNLKDTNLGEKTPAGA